MLLIVSRMSMNVEEFQANNVEKCELFACKWHIMYNVIACLRQRLQRRLTNSRRFPSLQVPDYLQPCRSVVF